MEDLYGDLENYNEVNAIAEMRKENNELRFKLKERDSAIEKLQKDFENLASNYKNLQMNFSSLLKTARSEIERKTQIICSLNTEKDMMVLNAIQNSTKNLLNIKRNMTRESQKSFKSNRNNNSSEFGKGNKKINSDTKKHSSERAVDNRTTSIETVSSRNTDESNIVSRPEKLEGYAEKNNDAKENTKVKPRALSIRNRRKSMPAVGIQFAKFSSDEEFEGNYSGSETFHKDWPARDDKNRRMFDQAYHDKHSHKVSETSGIDDKYSSYHESSRETNYKENFHRHYDRYRNRDTYDLSQRHRRRFSPERQHRTSLRDHSDDRLQRPEYGRQRVLESPPPERYDTHRKSRDRRFHNERENPYGERQRNRFERHTGKHKIQSDYDEPTSKRVRTESLGRPNEEVRWHTEIDHAEDPAITQMVADYTSCQSPDFMIPEALSTQPVKEIMNTATTPLEDPRIASKKYITNNEDGKLAISTITGRNVDLIAIDISKWNIDNVDMPDALRHAPQDTEHLVKQIYTDIDYPASNITMESGEIQTEINDPPLGDVVTESLFDDNEHEKNTQDEVEHKTVDAQVKHEEFIQTLSSSKQENLSKRNKYKIPKVKDKSSESQNPLSKLIQEMSPDKMVHEDLKKSKSRVSKNTKKDNVKTDDKKPMKRESCQINLNPDPDVDTTAPCLQRELRNRKIVEDDLELSDETCDYVTKPKVNTSYIEHKSKDVHMKKTQIVTENIEEIIDKNTYQEVSDNLKNSKVSIYVEVERTVTEADDPIPETNKKKNPKITEADDPISETNKKKKPKVTEADDAIPETNKKKKPKVTEADDPIPETNKKKKPKVTEAEDSIPETNKKKKPKRKTSKDKVKAVKESQRGKFECLDKKKKAKKEKATKMKDLKPKFSDLFGDSSTVDLITPGDLGIQVPDKQPQPSTLYFPIFEDAQDAIDVNVDKTEKKVSALPNIDKILVDPNFNKSEQLKFVIDTTNKASLGTIKEKSSDIEGADRIPTDDKTIVTYENVNVEASLKDPDVVKAVIISTGVQPQTSCDSVVDSTHVNKNLVDQIEKPVVHNVILPKLPEAPIQALATSTPHKNLLLNNQMDKDSIISEPSCNTSDSKIVRNDVSSTMDQSSASNGVHSQDNETDVPDVRIFVRRRRRVVKK